MATSNIKYSMDTCHQEETGWVLGQHYQCNIFILLIYYFLFIL